MNDRSGKEFWRSFFKERRSNLPLARREQASLNVFHYFKDLVDPCCYVLSFSNLKDEIDLSLLNGYLAEAGCLVLPKIHGKTLLLFRVTDLTHCQKGTYHIIEPIEEKCERIDYSDIHCALIPGLAFDRHNHRLGYGKGFYDRLLPDLYCPSYGIGFEEQFVEKLPVEKNDIPLTQVILF